MPAANDGSGDRRGGADPLEGTCLVWGYERVLHVSLVGQAAGLPAPEAIVEPLTQMMLGGVYGRPLATPGAVDSRPPATPA